LAQASDEDLLKTRLLLMAVVPAAAGHAGMR